MYLDSWAFIRFQLDTILRNVPHNLTNADLLTLGNLLEETLELAKETNELHRPARGTRYKCEGLEETMTTFDEEPYVPAPRSYDFNFGVDEFNNDPFMSPLTWDWNLEENVPPAPEFERVAPPNPGPPVASSSTSASSTPPPQTPQTVNPAALEQLFSVLSIAAPPHTSEPVASFHDIPQCLSVPEQDAIMED